MFNPPSTDVLLITGNAIILLGKSLFFIYRASRTDTPRPDGDAFAAAIFGKAEGQRLTAVYVRGAHFADTSLLVIVVH
jgi:hypothetical protein